MKEIHKDSMKHTFYVTLDKPTHAEVSKDISVEFYLRFIPNVAV
jgi:hypothetical protein